LPSILTDGRWWELLEVTALITRERVSEDDHTGVGWQQGKRVVVMARISCSLVQCGTRTGRNQFGG